jgi:RHS repeat-associated protein
LRKEIIDFFGNKVFEPFTSLFDKDRRRKSPEKQGKKPNNHYVRPHRKLIPEKVYFGYSNIDPTSYSYLIARLAVSRGNFTYQVPGRANTNPTYGGLNGDEHFFGIFNSTTLDSALQVDLTGQPSGVYDFTVTQSLGNFSPGWPGFSHSGNTGTGRLVLVNLTTSPFGSGVGLAGWQQLVPNPDGSLLLIDGDGSQLLFMPPTDSGPFVSPAGDFTKLEPQPDGTFRRTFPDQTVVAFNAQNLLASVTDRNGRVTRYVYDTQIPDRLVQIIDPVGLATTFTYTGSKVTKITDPADRDTLLEYDAVDGSGVPLPNANLKRVVNPDQSARSWQYDSRHHQIQATDEVGNSGRDYYDAFGRAYQAVRKDGSTVQIAPVEVHNLYRRAETTSLRVPTPGALPAAPSADATEEGIDALYADGNGAVVRYRVNRAGQLVREEDVMGTRLTIEYDAQNMPRTVGNASDSVHLTYDGRGNPILMSDALAGPFQGQVDTPLGFGSYFKTAADVNGDGLADLILLEGGGVTPVILLGVGNGSFIRANSLPVTCFNLALGFLDGDNRPDLVVGTNSGVKLLLNQGNGNFAAPQPLPGSTAVSYAFVVEDFDGDGRGDVAAVDFDTKLLRVWLGHGDGTFAAPVPAVIGPAVELSPYYLTTADVNNDGVPDLVSGFEPLGVLLGHRNPATGLGDGTFLPPTFLEYGVFGEVTGDGIVDLVTQFGVRPGRGDGMFDAVAHPQSLLVDALADLDGDGRLDVVGSDPHRGIAIAANLGGYFTSAVDIPFNNFSSFAAVADLDGDTHPDLLANTLVDFTYQIAARISNATGIVNTEGTASPRAYTFDPTFNQLASQTDDLGHQTLYQIDPANGNTLAQTMVVGQLDSPANGEMNDMVTTFTYTTGQENPQQPPGLIATKTDTLHRVTHVLYDALGRTTEITYAEGTLDEATQHFEYDTAGNQTAFIDENGQRTDYVYDSMNRLLRQLDPEPDGPGPLGRPTTVYTYYADGRVKTVTDPAGRVTMNTYDALGRLYDQTGPDPDPTDDQPAPVTQYRYDPAGNLHLVTDPLGYTTTLDYDTRNRLTDEIDAEGHRTHREYYSDDNLRSVTDPGGNLTQFEYDPRGRVMTITDPLGKTIQKTYNALQLTDTVDRLGRHIHFDYDDLGMLTTETWFAAGDDSTVNVIHYTYDMVGNQLSVSDNFSSLTYTYDNRDRVRTVDNAGTPGGVPQVLLRYTPDPVGHFTSVVDTINGQPGGRNDYTYDPLNRVTWLTQTGTGVSPKLVQFSYNQVGQVATIARYADLTGTQLVARSTYDYDGAGRHVSLVHASSTATLASYTFGYDAVGHITHRTDLDGVANFTYDKTGQLKSVTNTIPHDPSRTYIWDANGNPTGGGLTIGPSNRLLADTNFTYTYDDEGNLRTRTDRATGTVRTFEWDYYNQLVKVTDRNASGTPTQVVRYVYDALGRRIAKAVDATPLDPIDAVVTHFVYDRSDVLLEFLDDDGSGPHAPLISMRYLDGPAIDQVLAQENYLEPEPSLRVLWLLPDQLGSTRDLVDNMGVVRNHIIYDPFGRVLFQSNPAVTTRYLFTGREFDRETGLYYYRARYYDPATGRFLSEDPERFNGGDLSWYRYVKNDPLRGRDPSGREDALTEMNKLVQKAIMLYRLAKDTPYYNTILNTVQGVTQIAEQAHSLVSAAQVNRSPDYPSLQQSAETIDYLVLEIQRIEYSVRKSSKTAPINICLGESTRNPLVDVLLFFFFCAGREHNGHHSSVEWLFLIALGLLAANHYLQGHRRRRRCKDQTDSSEEDPDEEPLTEPRDQAVRLRPPGFSLPPGRVAP